MNNLRQPDGWCSRPCEMDGALGAQGDFFVRSGPGTVKLSSADAEEYIRTRFGPARPR